MNSMAKLYTDEIKRHFKVLFANWIPGSPVELGDYGILDGNIFIQLGKLKDDFDEFKGDVIQTSPDPTKDHKEFKSDKGVEVNLLAKGSLNAQGVPLAKATLDIRFEKENAIFFNAAGCATTSITNKAKIGEIIKALAKNKRWEKKWCVITDVVNAGKTLVAISQSSNSGITLEASSPVLENINLDDVSVKLNSKFEKSIGYKINADEGLNLLIGLCKLKNAFSMTRGGFRPSTMGITDSMEYQIENDPSIITENSLDELIFGQLGKD